MAIPANVRVQVNVPFPAQVFGSGPVTLAKLNGTYTIGFSVDGLTAQTPPPGNLTTDFVPFYDSIQKTWFKSSLFDLQFQGILPVSKGGTNSGAASGAALDNITGFAATGMLVRTAAGTYAFRTVTAGTGVTVTNGDGIAGNPTIALTAVIGAAGPAGTATQVPVITWNAQGQLTAVTTAATGVTANGTAAVGQLPGIPSNAAPTAGNVGEVVSSRVPGSSVALTTNTPANATSIILNPGDWDVWGSVIAQGAAATTVGNVSCSISIASATFDASDETKYNEHPFFNLTVYNPASYGLSSITVPVGAARLLLNAATTVYLVAQSTFAAGTSSCGGALYARRRR